MLCSGSRWEGTWHTMCCGDLGAKIPVKEPLTNTTHDVVEGMVGRYYVLHGGTAAVLFQRLPWTSGIFVLAIHKTRSYRTMTDT